jgi:chromosome segregation protein
MQLKQLELHGFKTFAGKVQFRFADGITAVVGPNGSGKSNLADGVRWILGEQRPALLRARRSEDMIFSGTERRARMGMAQGFLTIDNSEGLLPVDFSEVVVGRRIYRNGESEYLINGNRVRLRDVHELLAHVGIGANSYTVIGQGLVDAALSLRAEERRQLFEDAAGLGAYQGKRDEVLRRLGQTEEHLTRIRDIVAEIEPRLGRLRRQAERAEEYTGLVETLNDLLRQFYGYRWGQAVQALSGAKATLDEARTQLRGATLQVTSIEQQLDRLRRRQGELREALERSRRERGQLRTEAERLRRERAVTLERERSFERQQESLRQEQESLETEAAELRGRLDASNRDGESLLERRAGAQAELEEAQATLAGAETVRAAHRRTLEEARRALGKLTARQSELSQRRGTLGDRQRQLISEAEGHQQALAALAERLEPRDDEVRQLAEEVTVVQGQRDTLRSERATLLEQRREATAAQRTAQEALHTVQRELTQLVTRRDLLARLRREGAGYGAGVRALLAESTRFGERLLGPVAEHFRVPEHLVSAVDAALGEMLHAMVLRESGDGVQSWLYASKVGRVTLLPLAHLSGPESTRLPEGDGILGRAADLVQADDPTLLEHLLGDWLVVQDWSVVDSLNGTGQLWNLVTLDGQVRLRRGAIIAGHGTGSGDALLAQSREWAELPERIAPVEQQQTEAQVTLHEAAEHLHALEERLQGVERELAESERHAQKVEAALQRERRDAEKLQQEQVWRQGLIRKAEREGAALRQQGDTIGGELEALEREHHGTEERIGDLEAQLEASHPATLRQAVEQVRTRLAVMDEQLAGWQRSREALKESLERLAQRQAAKARQASQLEQEAETLAQRTVTLEAEAHRVEATLEAALQQARPMDQEHSQNEERLAELEEQHLAARQRRHEREEEAHSAHLALQAAEERLAHLREQIETDLGMAQGDDTGEEFSREPMVSIEELLTSLPKVVALPEGLENDVRRLRRRISHLGPINPEAPAEYAELVERHTFLTEQSDDLTRASHDLRRIVAELDVVMRERFVTTFQAIDEAFGVYFTRLFNGGQARLELTDPENAASTGVELIACPPGKRAQNIALLSGGERALTAAALIFAILKVSPAPFCVLDEVDAMLDEANVGRFRDTLMELARETQFIVVTHNRGTIEAARAIYGISQSDPGISEVISLQLEEAIRASKH